MFALSHLANKAVYLLVFSAGPVNITWAQESERVLIILQCFFPAQSAGDAVTQALIMRDGRFNPAGRLPYTWYRYTEQVITNEMNILSLYNCLLSKPIIYKTREDNQT